MKPAGPSPPGFYATGRTSTGVVEPLVTFLVATALSSALFWIGTAVPVVQANLHGAIAVIFLAAPRFASRLSRRPFDYHSAGLRLEPLGLNLKVLGTALAITWPLFLLAFLLFYGVTCRPAAPTWWMFWMEPFAPTCGRWLGWTSADVRLPADFLLLALSQVVVIAVPEEMFFRGYLYARLEERWPSRRRLLGAKVGWPLVLSSLLFALGHVLVDFDPQRLAVFVPGLVFGWMRARAGSIAAAAVLHALSNLLSDVLHTSFFS
jgi:uncharacterized protein